MTAYKTYLKSEHWSLLRGAKLQIVPHCERCGGKSEIEVHHKVYRNRWADSKIGDLETMCHHCHTTHHAVEIAKENNVPRKQIRKALRPVKPDKPIEHRPAPPPHKKDRVILPGLRCVNWLNRKSIKMNKESYAWMADKGLRPDQSGWRDRIVGHICPYSFFTN